jgi:hypothetical protein
MKVYLKVDGARRALDVRAEYAILSGPCPKCGALPCNVQGTGRRISSDDRAYEATGVCLACKQAIGTIRAETGTLFGVEEDERVLASGRWRVY